MIRFLPKTTTLVYCLIFPVVVSLYVFADTNIMKTVEGDSTNYFFFTQDAVGSIIYTQAWQQWLSRALDFVLWGVIGGVILSVIWAFSASRVAMENHKAQEAFVHFRVPRGSWHGHFLIVGLVKSFLAVAIFYGFVLLIFVALPALIQSVGKISLDSDNSSIWTIILPFILMVAIQYVLGFVINLFKAIHVDE